MFARIVTMMILLAFPCVNGPFVQAQGESYELDHSAVTDSAAYSPPDLITEYDLSGLVRRTISISFFLGAACLGCVIWAHYKQGRPSRRNSLQQRMELLESTTLAPRCFLHLIRIDDQHLLVTRDASGFRGVTPLHSFADSLRSSGVTSDEEMEETNTWPTLDSPAHALSHASQVH